MNSLGDGAIVEDGTEQETAFFSTDSAPFDMVLLLDFSGSTQEKRGLIKKAAKRFVEVARPDDRVAVIAFANDQRILSDFTKDKNFSGYPEVLKSDYSVKNASCPGETSASFYNASAPDTLFTSFMAR